MKWNILINSDIFCYLLNNEFNPADKESEVIRRRISNNILVYNESIIEYWQKYILENRPDLIYFFQNLIPTFTSQPENFLLVDENTTIDDELLKTILEKTAINIQNSIVVDTYSLNTLRKYKVIRFCQPSDFKRDYPDVITIESITLYNNGLYLKNLFSHLEFPINIDVGLNKSASELATFIAQFLRNTSKIIIQDKFFENNHLNFEKYIFPYIESDTEIIIKSKRFSDNNLKRRLEQKFGLKIQCRSQDKESEIHRGLILTDNYEISLGYRLATFGENNKTRCERVIIKEQLS